MSQLVTSDTLSRNRAYSTRNKGAQIIISVSTLIRTSLSSSVDLLILQSLSCLISDFNLG